ncbi:hypothetical protein GQX74_007312 [Glossina fuscipes]|nr:hypothetical protein GQX74_007312 [Glossina fuscipes]
MASSCQLIYHDNNPLWVSILLWLQANRNLAVDSLVEVFGVKHFIYTRQFGLVYNSALEYAQNFDIDLLYVLPSVAVQCLTVVALSFQLLQAYVEHLKFLPQSILFILVDVPIAKQVSSKFLN